jgi:hypothetical protein
MVLSCEKMYQRSCGKAQDNLTPKLSIKRNGVHARSELATLSARVGYNPHKYLVLILENLRSTRLTHKGLII